MTWRGTAPPVLPPPYVGTISTYSSSTSKPSSQWTGIRVAGSPSRSTKRWVFSDTEEK